MSTRKWPPLIVQRKTLVLHHWPFFGLPVYVDWSQLVKLRVFHLVEWRNTVLAEPQLGSVLDFCWPHVLDEGATCDANVCVSWKSGSILVSDPGVQP